MPFSHHLNWVYRENISSTFQAIQKLSAHLTNLFVAVFCKCLGMFLGENSFSQSIFEFREIIRNSEDLM